MFELSSKQDCENEYSIEINKFLTFKIYNYDRKKTTSMFY